MNIKIKGQNVSLDSMAKALKPLVDYQHPDGSPPSNEEITTAYTNVVHYLCNNPLETEVLNACVAARFKLVNGVPTLDYRE